MRQMTTEGVDHTAGTRLPADTVPGTVAPPAASEAVGEPARRAPETARLYAADWQRFVAWCQAACRAPLPAAGATVAAFLAATGENSAGALGRCAAAIADRHRQQGFASPAADPAVRTILSAARRAAIPRRHPPPSPARLVRMAAACPGDLAGLRDRALLLLAAAGLGRAALVGLDAEQLRFSATSVELAVPVAGSEDARMRRAIPCGASLASCPVQALRDWLETSGTRFGPVFRKIDRWGTIEQRRLGTDAIRRVLARRTPRRRRHTRATA
jgi:site-specific recombinase XerD